MNPEDRENIMEHWDRWVKYIAEGGGGSWPRDAFESLLDYFFLEKFNIGDTLEDENGNIGQVIIHWNDGDHVTFINDTNHQNPKVIGNMNDKA